MDLAVLGCTACHSGRAAGILIPGLGNKTIDPHAIGKTVKKAQSVWQHLIAGKIKNDPNYAYVHEKAMNFATVLADEDISNLTRGLVPDSVIKTFFYRDQGVPYGPEIERTQVKVPSLWGFAEKRKVGVFADGSLNSQNYAWAFGAELMASDSGEHLRASMPKLKHVVDNVIGKFLPPKYPFEIDQELAAKGKVLVENNCFECHGNHNRDPEGIPIFEPPELVLHDLVNTHPQRLDYGNSKWVDLAEQGSVSDLIKFNRHLFGYGYFAPKLWGIWSRFPYLHNGSVPTLHHLLLPPEKRPTVFDMEDAGELYRFDKNYVGLRTYRNPAMIAAKEWDAERGDRNIYWIERPEHSNQGHYFDFMENWTYDDRAAVVEFLKTL
jgi:mono/diheme cytochrome c family protein